MEVMFCYLFGINRECPFNLWNIPFFTFLIQLIVNTAQKMSFA